VELLSINRDMHRHYCRYSSFK